MRGLDSNAFVGGEGEGEGEEGEEEGNSKGYESRGGSIGVKQRDGRRCHEMEGREGHGLVRRGSPYAMECNGMAASSREGHWAGGAHATPEKGNPCRRRSSAGGVWRGELPLYEVKNPPFFKAKFGF